MSNFNEGKPVLKRPLTLDFSKHKMITPHPVLSSPDLNMLKVGTPELEKIILNSGSMNTPTPSAVDSSLLYSRTVTEEQESFSAGFEDALKNLHNNNSQASDSSNTVYTDMEQPIGNFIPTIKEEPQTVPNINNGSPPVSPVDMEYQEKIKLERKRQRNRLAASKCRSRKLEKISKLEDKVKHLKTENSELGGMVNQLREHVNSLKIEVLQHVNNGCQIMALE
ncbi:PREDICTED: transcription factor jun-D isoform X2 [Nicrophorus vespilloides]|uniref:Transcription factor jun-D isoform X2 n=1 Tax=Nicrophorus vespilloides TaxID=110193 RepID=A0ABM1M5S8_NICVS|nr:PREDICTED: transcription factor jun-D isoform X2 [Nicrophorus vespilloides]